MLPRNSSVQVQQFSACLSFVANEKQTSIPVIELLVEGSGREPNDTWKMVLDKNYRDSSNFSVQGVHSAAFAFRSHDHFFVVLQCVGHVPLLCRFSFNCTTGARAFPPWLTAFLRKELASKSAVAAEAETQTRLGPALVFTTETIFIYSVHFGLQTS